MPIQVKRGPTMMWLRLLLGGALAVAGATTAAAYTAYVSNEKSNTVSVIDTTTWTVTKTIKVGQRPRGIGLTRDGKFLMVACGDDDTIQLVDTATHEVTGSLPSGPDPELFILHPNGKVLYVANEDDNLVSIIDMEKRSLVKEVQVGVEPEGMGISPDGKFLVNTSETTNMAHFIDTESGEIVANVLVDARPRWAEFKQDGSEVWVSSEIGGTVSVIDPAKREVKRKISFEVRGLKPEAIQPVGVRRADHQGRQDRLRGARARQPRGGDQWRDSQGRKISAGRPARLAARLHAGREIPARDQRRLQ
jgi:PQQ-dependent catabolism-associated beta-propeller protein